MGGLLSRTTTTAVSIAASPADDDDDNGDDDDDDDDGRKTVRRRQPIRLRHSGRRKQNEHNRPTELLFVGLTRVFRSRSPAAERRFFLLYPSGQHDRRRRAMNIAADGTAVRVLLVTVVAALLAVRVRCGVQDGYYGGGGGVRFAKLDKFMHDRMGLAGDRSGETTTVVGRTTGGLLSRTTTTAASIAASPADDDDDDDDGGGGDIDEDIDDDDDDDDDDDGDDDDDDDDDGRKTVRRRQPIRLRHSGRRKQNDLYDQYIQNQEPARTMSPVSENKWKHLGSRVAVDKTFRNVYNKGTVHIPSQGDKESGEVYKHQVRMAKEALCKVPRSRVIKVIDHYPSSNKKYVPSCTVLHVCSDDTGCCGSPTLKCGPKIAQPVMLHFLVYTAPELSDRQSPNQSHQSYQTLRFYNHTECHCQPKDDDSMPKDSSITPTSVDPVDMRDFDDDNSGRYTNSMDVPKKSTSLLDNCKCPTEYTVRYLANGSCSCDCFDKQHECIRYKKGNIYFNFFDRYCITSGQCLSPMCEYGLYSHRTGRCPKKFETLYSFKKKYYF